MDATPEKLLIDRLQSVMFSDGGEYDLKTNIIVSLADSADLLKEVFSRKELKSKRNRINQIISGDEASEEIRKIIEEISVIPITVLLCIPVIMMSS